MDKTALLKKVRALAEHGVGGEAENAEKLLARMMKKYGISEEELDEETRVRHDFTYHGGEEKKILRQVVYKVTGGYAYELVYTASGRKVRTQLGADCTPAEKVEIEYLFDFYKRLWEKEKDAFLAAYIQKPRIFAIRADVEPQEISREEALKMGALMQGMSDESPLRAVECGQGQERGRFRRTLAGVRAEFPYSRRGMGANVRPRKNRCYQRVERLRRSHK